MATRTTREPGDRVLATHRFPLDETMAAYDLAAAAETNALKVVLEAAPVHDERAEREVALVGSNT